MSAPAPEKIERDGSTLFVSSDGVEYKTRSGAWKKNKKLYAQENPEQEINTGDVSTQEINDSPDDIPIYDDQTSFEWSEFTLDDQEGSTEAIPGVLKAITPGTGQGKMSKKEMEMAMQTSEALLGMGYRLSDVLLTKYKRAVCEDPDALVKHSDPDYAWISHISNAALVSRGVLISNTLTPVGVASVANAYWFGKPILEIQTERKKKLFKKETFQRIPLIGRLFGKRRRKNERANVEENV